MTPNTLPSQWSRRIYVGLLALSLAYLLLFIFRTLNPERTPDTLTIDAIAAIGAGIGLISSSILLAIPKVSSSVLITTGVFGIALLTTAYIAYQSGGVWSAFTPAWALLVFFAPLFGALGWVSVLVLIGALTAGVYLDGDLTTQFIISLGISSALPLIVGVLVWKDSDAIESAGDKNVTSLANRLSEVANKSEIVINAIGDGVIAIDSKGSIDLINPAAQEILGWGKQDALLLNYKSVFKLTDENNQELDPALDPLQQVLNTNQQARGNKLAVTTKSNKKLFISIVVSPVGGPGSGAIAVFRDITNERAEEREQAEFISTASHEMRTPVASIEGYLGLALNPNTATVDQRASDFINKAHEAAQHLGRLFQDLLDVSKSEDGRMTNIPKVVDLVPFAGTIVEGLTQRAAEKGLTLTFVPLDTSAQRKIMPVYFTNVDNDHLREVLDNLIENAIKYTPQGDVSVDISGSEDVVVMSIKDTGLGIPAEDIPHLFQKFYRVSNPDRQSIGGTGLGLYLCRRLVEGMQGRLWVESTFGEGSVFKVELPRIDGQRAEQLRSEQARQAAQQVAAQPEPLPAPAPVTVAQAPAVVAAPAVAPYPQQPIAPTPPVAPQPVAQPAPQAPVTYAPPAYPQQAQPVPTAPPVAPATTVPRGEALTREQIMERARQLEIMAQQQRQSEQPRQ